MEYSINLMKGLKGMKVSDAISFEQQARRLGLFVADL
jgi:hypothetical protein